MTQVLVIAQSALGRAEKKPSIVAWKDFAAIPAKGETVPLSDDCQGTVEMSRGRCQPEWDGDVVGVIYVKVTPGVYDKLHNEQGWNPA